MLTLPWNGGAGGLWVKTVKPPLNTNVAARQGAKHGTTNADSVGRWAGRFARSNRRMLSSERQNRERGRLE
jgi:hypothetical protein